MNHTLPITDQAYYYTFIGRICGFPEITYTMESPATEAQAFEEFKTHLKERFGSDYNPLDVRISHVFFSTHYIDYLYLS